MVWCFNLYMMEMLNQFTFCFVLSLEYYIFILFFFPNLILTKASRCFEISLTYSLNFCKTLIEFSEICWFYWIFFHWFVQKSANNLFLIRNLQFSAFFQCFNTICFSEYRFWMCQFLQVDKTQNGFNEIA